jgi:hypothetical protein
MSGNPQDFFGKLGDPLAIQIAKRWVRVLPKQAADLRRTIVISHGTKSLPQSSQSELDQESITDAAAKAASQRQSRT